MSNEIVKLSLADLTTMVVELQAKIAALEAKNEPKNSSTREMTDEDAFECIYGKLKDKKHKEVASELGLSYGQVYSARLEFTFKNVHKKAKAEGKTNSWMK